MKLKKINFFSYNTLFTIGTCLVLITCILNMFSFIDTTSISLILRLIIFIIGASLMLLASIKKDKIKK